jgi:hypothetical protein
VAHSVHCLPFFKAGDTKLADACAEDTLAGGRLFFCGSGFDEDEAHRRLAGARELHLFAGVDGGEDVGEVFSAKA